MSKAKVVTPGAQSTSGLLESLASAERREHLASTSQNVQATLLCLQRLPRAAFALVQAGASQSLSALKRDGFGKITAHGEQCRRVTKPLCEHAEHPVVIVQWQDDLGFEQVASQERRCHWRFRCNLGRR